MNNYILEIRNLTTVYHTPRGDAYALRDVNFSVRRGEVLAIVGESGSGKSTLGLSVMRLIEPPGEITKGKVIFNGSDGSVSILELNPYEIRKFRWKSVAMIFQSAMNVLNPVARIEEQFYDTFRAHNINGNLSDRINHYLQIAGLGPNVRRLYPHELSGGMRQRVMIALALSCEPELLIADEPTTALDVVIQREILSSILKIKRDFNLTVIFITHDLAVASSLADRIAIFYAGRPVELGKIDTVVTQPKHPYTGLLLSSTISMDSDRDAPLRTLA
ncbi:MAG TPA: ABC transporter ATP-binding protein, partial [Thermoplasmataceae archaeon]|nr:ABC transporter ATP-binding protein [Thermoplasmataceae archaeon]